MKTKKSPSVSVSVSLPSHVRDVARQAAFDDNRPLSGLITRLLEIHLIEQGYLEAPRRPLKSKSNSLNPPDVWGVR
jgi:hypothetical protein